MNNKNLKNIGVILGLAVVGYFVWAPNFQSTKPKKAVVSAPKKEKQKNISVEESIPSVTIEEDWGERSPFEAIAHKSSSGGASKGKGPVVAGIFWSGPNPSAIIDNEVVGIGSKVGSMTVKEIKEGAVILANGGKEVILKLQTQ
jgi:hypothetical protein